MTPNRPTPRHIIKKAKVKHKEWIVKEAQEKQRFKYNRTSMRLSVDFYTEIFQVRRQWQNIFINIFSQSECWENILSHLCVLFMVSFTMQKLFSLMRSHLFMFAFYFHYSGKWVQRKSYCCGLCQSVPPMFFPGSFRVHGLMFKSLIHFEFIFVYGARECSNFILLQETVQFSQHLLLNRLSFLHCIFLPPLL